MPPPPGCLSSPLIASASRLWGLADGTTAHFCKAFQNRGLVLAQSPRASSSPLNAVYRSTVGQHGRTASLFSAASRLKGTHGSRGAAWFSFSMAAVSGNHGYGLGGGGYTCTVVV